jgi:UDP-2,3-diacylglucosamine pyrophosphatase LpxH
MSDFKDVYSAKTRIKHLTLSGDTRLIIMSDMHRGDGTGSDDFAHNSLVYKCALDYYLENGFTYIELGDAEELWENKTFDQIYITHTSVYEKLAHFHHSNPEKTRYIKIWGNHDLEWRKDTSDLDGLFPGIRLYEAALLDKRILMWHGHQADPSCLRFRATVAKFFVGGIWMRMQRLGMKDPTRAATNPGRANKVDQRLHEWGTHNDEGIQVIIAGHTHRPVFENLSLTEKWLLHLGIGTPGIEHKTPDPSYYNTGSCVHPRCITGIEITAGQDQYPDIKLIKWAYSAQSESDSASSHVRDDFNLVVKRSVLETSTL